MPTIVHLASEMVPFSKTGGLADVVGALPAALARLGHSVSVIVPAHRPSLGDDIPGRQVADLADLGIRAFVFATEMHGVEVLLVDAPQVFVRPAPYSVSDGDYPDNPIRFAFFVRTALRLLAQRPEVDILHCHDWQAALAPLLLHHPSTAWPHPYRPRTVLTIHNLAYQGVFPTWTLEAAGLPRELFSVSHLEFYGQVSFLKGGIVAADAITTVSPTYAREILTPAFGCGLEGVLAQRAGSLFGILNGLDTDAWNPETDPHLPHPYRLRNVVSGKRAARAVLARELQLAPGVRPLAGMVSRLVEQKGVDLLGAAIDDIIALGFDVVVLGRGARRWEELLTTAEAAHPGRVRVVLGFNEPLAHRIYAASDVFLMPSRFEPCGLGQLIALRYGALPVVSPTGGLADTVVDALRPDGCGFVFAPSTPRALLAALVRAKDVLAAPEELARLRRNAMRRDVSWAVPAQEYTALYQRLLDAPGAPAVHLP
jgi:starch synthase